MAKFIKMFEIGDRVKALVDGDDMNIDNIVIGLEGTIEDINHVKFNSTGIIEESVMTIKWDDPDVDLDEYSYLHDEIENISPAVVPLLLHGTVTSKDTLINETQPINNKRWYSGGNNKSIWDLIEENDEHNKEKDNICHI